MSKTPQIFILPTTEAFQVSASLYGEGEKRWKTLARVVATNVERRSSDRATVVLRLEGEPRLAIAGWFSRGEAEHIRTAIPWFIDTLSRLRYVDYAQVEADCECLGKHLREHLSDEALENASFVGIPRGGTVVLGLLSYVLDLDHSQISPQNLDTGPLVVIDDCFLSGARVARFLNDHPCPSEVVIAGLYSHPDLRSAVERERPQVQTCVTARDLTDYAPAIYGDDYEAWTARWERRETGQRYWTGIPEHLCFPWSEPDRGLWNAETEQTERAWTVVPSDQCLKTRFGDQADSEGTIQVQRSTSGAITVPPEVFYATFSDRVLVGRAEAEKCLELNGSAADFWTALVTYETISEAQTALCQQYDVEPERLASDLRTFVKSLIERQLVKEESDALTL